MSKKLIYLVPFVLVIGLGLTTTVQADILGWWRLDDGAGNTAIDFSGNGNDGTLEGDPQWVAGWIGGALEFDGDDFVDIDNTEDLANYTIAAWVKSPVAPSGDAPSGPLHREQNYQFNWNHSDDTYRGAAAMNVGGTWHAAKYMPLEADTWYHLAATYDGEVFNAYRDGELITSNDAPSGPPNAEVNTLKLARHAAAAQFFTGTVDDAQVYDEALGPVDILGIMTGEGFPFSSGPSPKDGAYHPDTWVNLAWRTGDFAVSHDVYIGDNFDAVNEGAEGTFIGNQADTFLVIGFPGFPYPDGLVPGTTYYWRIDEVNDTEPNSPWKGDIWSFRIPPKTAYFPDPADGAESVGVDEQLSWTAGFGAKLHYVYFGDNFDEVDNAAGALPQGVTTYTPGTLKMAKTYYWRVDEFDIAETHKGDVWSFLTQGAVSSPEPANDTVDVTQTPVLTWTPGFGASHEVYFGADAASLELKGSGNLGSESYEPGQLEWDTTYYWRVDEANNANADSPWTGPLWSFTTADFLIIDDMESYNDINEGEPGSNRIYIAWADGFGDQTNGSVVGNANAPFAEQTIVHGGLQSMPMSYDNAVGKSEATLTLTSNKDWTVKGVTTLTIWYRGDSANAAENLYVALNGNAVINNDNSDAAQATAWTQWNIDLQAFGVNLANVNTITLGLGNRANPTAGGSGIMYFDDIRLYPPAP